MKPEDLKVIVSEMRALGVSHLKTPEYEIELGAPPVLPPPERKPPEEGTEGDASEKEWYAFWTKATRSSGAAIPPYPRPRALVVPK
jgi:hypothetical protein